MLKTNILLICSYYNLRCLCYCRGFFYDLLYYQSEKTVAPHSSTLAWKIPWMEEPGRLQSMGSRRDGHNWATSLSYCYETITIIYCWMKKIRCRAVYMILYLYKAKWKHIYLCQHIQIRAQYFRNDAQKQTAYWEGEITE